MGQTRIKHRRKRHELWGEWEAKPLPRDATIHVPSLDYIDEVWMNRIYLVYIGTKGLLHALVRRIDERPIREWSHMQRIKNELLGTEVEAVELYPAESRKVDDHNWYHLWAIPEGERFPFGLDPNGDLDLVGKP